MIVWGDDPGSPVFRRWTRRHARLGTHSAITRLAAFHLILYPEAVALASVFAMPRWQQLALTPDREDNYYRFYDEIAARTRQAISIRAHPEDEACDPLGERFTSLRAEFRVRAGIKDPDGPTLTWRLGPYILPPETHHAAR